MQTEKDMRELIDFAEEKINSYANGITKNPDKADRAAMGQLNFYVSFRNAIKHHLNTELGVKPQSDKEKIDSMYDLPSYRDFGLLEAINDTLVFMGIFKARQFFQFHISDSYNEAVPVNIAQLLDFIEDQINHYSSSITVSPDRADRAYIGQLIFYISFRNVVKDYRDKKQGKTSKDLDERIERMRDLSYFRDYGLVEAVNDTLILMGLYNPSKKGQKFFEI